MALPPTYRRLNITLSGPAIQAAREWRWRDLTGVYWNPTEMETRHVFNVLRMFWNHTVPDYCKTHDNIKYELSSLYTEEAKKLAIVYLAVQLCKRQDLSGEHRRNLQFMFNWMQRGQIIKGMPNVHLA